MNPVLVAAFVLVSCSGAAASQEAGAGQSAAPSVDKPNFSMGGLLFGDFYGVPSHHLPEGDGSGGMWIRRGYLTFDGDFSERWFGRMRFELNQSGKFETYTFSVKFKDLYAGLHLGEHDLLLGLSPTPTFDLIEGVWGLRYLARTPLDLQGVASRGTGVAIKGPITESGSLSYRAMVGAGPELSDGLGDSLKWMGALTWRFSRPWLVDLYADYEVLRGESNRRSLQAFLGYDDEDLRWGLQYWNQDRKDDPPLELASAFVVARVSEDTSLIGRVDHLFEPSPKGNGIAYLPFDPRARATLLLGAVELRVHENLTLTPSVTIVAYERNEEGVKPPTDSYLRLTFFIDLQ